MKEIELNHGKVALVSDHRFDRLNQWHWMYHHNGYAFRLTSRSLAGKRKTIFMHNEIMPPPLGMEVDHKDRDGLNNQDDNLRYSTKTQNRQNRGRQSNNRSGYKGVCWSEQRRKYRAQIVVNGKGLHLGEFKDPEKAARTYDEAAIKYFGEFAQLNFPK